MYLQGNAGSRISISFRQFPRKDAVLGFHECYEEMDTTIQKLESGFKPIDGNVPRNVGTVPVGFTPPPSRARPHCLTGQIPQNTGHKGIIHLLCKIIAIFIQSIV